MSEQLPPSSGRSAEGGPDADWRSRTIPGVGAPTAQYPSSQGSPHAATATPTATPTAQYTAPPGTSPQYSTQPVAVRRPDALASLLLLLAGIAAGVSLLLTWLPHSRLTGLDLVRRGFSLLLHDIGTLFSSGMWQPLVIVLAGGALFVVGLLLLVPARAHRFLGLLALLLSLAAGAGVLVPLADAGWHPARFGVGFWFAAAVAVLGFLGALKALFTGRKYATAVPMTR